jgi:hypothetical protein
MFFMGSGKNMFPVFFVVCIVLVFSACTDFFSTSLAPWAKRDPSKLIPKVNAANVAELITRTESDPDLSLAVLTGIRDAINETSNEAEKAALRSAALRAAANASGLGNALFSNAGTIISTLDNPEELQKAAVNAVNSMSNLNQVSNILLNNIIPAPSSPGFTSFVENAPATDLALSATVILLGEAQTLGSPEAVEGYITGTGSGPHFEFDNPKTPAENTAVILAQEVIEIVDDPVRGDASGSLKNILENIGFKSTVVAVVP